MGTVDRAADTGIAEERPFLPAVVGPRAALWLDREAGVALRKAGRLFLANGREGLGRELLQAAAHLRESGRLWTEAVAAGSAAGTSEVPIDVEGARSVRWAGAAEAAKRLGVGTRRVTQMCEDEDLLAVKVSGRWLIDDVDLAAKVEERQRRRDR